MEKSLLIKKLAECKDVNKKLTEAYELSMSTDSTLEPSELFTRCTVLIKDISEFAYDFDYIKEEAVKFGLHRNEFFMLCDAVCEYLGNTIENALLAGPIFTTPSHLEGCPVKSNDLVMYTAKPFEPSSHPIVEFDKERYKTLSSYLENTGYYNVYITTLEK